MQKLINKIKDNVRLLEMCFGHIEFPENYPSENVSAYVNGSKPSLTFYCPADTYLEQEDSDTVSNRERVLDLIGTKFGKDGWFRERDSSNRYFHWVKSVAYNSIELKINYAERIPLSIDKTPVSPKSFPLLLQ